MNGFAQFPPDNGSGGPPPQQRTSLDMMSNGSRLHAERNGALPMPVGGPQRQYGGMPGEMQGFGSMGMPRSPPKNKSEYAMLPGGDRTRLKGRADTQHVPCKFYLQGACQAGRTCPFSHDVESSTRPAPCKYFAKGGCKFGRKCALLHITPDGTVINRAPPFPPAQPFSASQQQPGTYPQPPTPGLLSMQTQGLEQRINGDLPPDFDNYQYGPRNGYDVPQIDMTYASASPQYGSPPQERQFGRSPPSQGLSVLDAPLPNSFDSNGISMAARYGPIAASLPPRFGVESPPSSLPRTSQIGNTALQDLHKSAFGDRGMDGVLAGTSPPSGPDEPLTFPKRSLHSERLRAPRYQMISASLGTKLPTQSFEYSDEDDGDTDREEDLLPASLRDLIPDGKARRESRSRIEDENRPSYFLQRRTVSGHGTPQESKVGSPQSSSPSRFTGVWGRAQSARGDGEAIVGSPLRNASFNFITSSPRTNGDLSPTISSPPRQASMSMLTQELQRTKLDNKLDAVRSQAAASSVGMTRTLSNGSNGRTSLDRTLSSASRGRDKIDEEQELFDMEEIGDHAKSAPRAIASNGSRTWSQRAAFASSSPGSGESGFGAIGSKPARK